MKIKSDFTTNSSSSSFIIAHKAMPQIDESTMAQYPFLRGIEKMIARVFDEGSETIKNSEDLDKWFLSQYGWGSNPTIKSIIEDDTYLEEKYKSLIVKLVNGYHISIKDVDYNEEQMSEFIQGLDDGENIIVESEH